MAVAKRSIPLFLRRLKQLRCWHVSAGEPTLPTFCLALGRKVPRQRQLRNANQPLVYRRFEGEAQLLVSCAWRLQRRGIVVAGSRDEDSRIINALELLRGARVLRTRLRGVAWDLEIGFSGGITLAMFGDLARGPVEYTNNWQLEVGRRVLVAGPGENWSIAVRRE